MNLEDVIDPEYGLQQDEWSLSKPTFGEECQLEIVGWSGRDKGVKKLYRVSKKYYVLKCSKCSQDRELFGEGYFKSNKSSLLNLSQTPCGCAKHVRWSKDQYSTLCTRKASELGYTFLGFVGEWKAGRTKIKMLCEKHGEWGTGNASYLINLHKGCPECCGQRAGGSRTKKSDPDWVASFFASGAFHPDTHFIKVDRLNSECRPVYWKMICPECGEAGESTSGNLKQGQRPCACNMHRQQECYINWIVDDHENVAVIKFGIARDSKQRIKSQDRQSAYEVRQYQVYSFPSVASCKQAERECKKELETGVVLKRDMPDGYSETTWAFNVGKVKDIYERNGGVLV